MTDLDKKAWLILFKRSMAALTYIFFLLLFGVLIYQFTSWLRANLQYLEILKYSVITLGVPAIFGFSLFCWKEAIKAELLRDSTP